MFKSTCKHVQQAYEYSAQDVSDYWDRNFAIPKDGYESEIEGFKSDDDNDL